MSIKLLIGLGNPGAQYTFTRHNAGQWFIEMLAKKYNATFKIDKKFQADLAIIDHADCPCRLVMPLSFMNLSGTSIRLLSEFYKISADEIIVIHDELDLPAGTIRLKSGGGHGGHNGLRDIMSQLASNAFHRLRIGIGHPGHKELVANYVLTRPSQAEREQITTAITQAVEIIPTLFKTGLAAAMNSLNR
ncbi:MAG: aminoacyl-tRNA hydrolase [Legionella sp.]